MPELPEICNLAKQMHRKLRGLEIASIEVAQEKCLNIPAARFERLVTGKAIGSVTYRGKWVLARLEPGAHLMLNLGMGGDCFYHKPGADLPEKYQVAFRFTDGSALSLRFWWFGYVHAATDEDLADHKMTATLGLDPLGKRQFTLEAFLELLGNRRGGIKALLMDQKHVAGIGNVYIQDILFRAGLHPLRKIPDISPEEREKLHAAIVEHLTEAASLGGLRYEKDLYGKSGRWDAFEVGYKEGEPCPACGTIIEKVKTGSTASYVCASCQV